MKATFGGLWYLTMFPGSVLGQTDPASMPPQEDDLLVKLGDPALKPLTVGDIQAGAEFISAWPMAPSSKVVRNGNRLNEVLLIRLDQTVLAYSALCPHAGCNVTTWIPEEGLLSCDCHASDFDARASGQVIAGPASRPLPPLPLKISGDVLAVARPFATSIRFDE